MRTIRTEVTNVYKCGDGINGVISFDVENNFYQVRIRNINGSWSIQTQEDMEGEKMDTSVLIDLTLHLKKIEMQKEDECQGCKQID